MSIKSKTMQQLRMPSLAEMQKCKVYFRRDIKTTNPRKLFRYIANTLNEMGYTISYNTVNIQKDPIGDTGSVDANIIAEKVYKIEVKREKINLIATALGILGLLFTLIGLIGNNVGVFLFGIIMMGGAIYIALKIKVIERKVIPCDINIYVKGVGEIYRGRRAETSGGKGIEQDQVITEMSLNLTGDVLLDYEKAIRVLKEDINFLLERVDTFTE